MYKSKKIICLGAMCSYVAFSLINVPTSLARSVNLWESKYTQQLYNGSVSGIDGKVLAGASIRNVSKNTVTVTNAQGQFAMTGSIGDIIAISYTGYTAERIILDSNVVLQIKLKEDAQDLDEVVVIGYNSLRESNISGAVSRVDMANADKRRVQDVAQMLQGQTSGVTVTQSTGQPGG